MYLISGVFRALSNFLKTGNLSRSSVFIAASAITVCGMLFLTYINSTRIAGVFFSHSTLSLFLSQELSSEERKKLLEELKKHPLVQEAELVSPKKAIHSLAQDLNWDPNLFPPEQVANLPHSIDIKVALGHEESIQGLAKTFGGYKEVTEVVYASQILEKIKRFFQWLLVVGFFFCFFMFTAFGLTIANSTKLSLNNRKREVEILHHTGAPRSFIATVFAIEGLLVAVFSWALGISTVYVGYKLFLSVVQWEVFGVEVRTLVGFFPLPYLLVSFLAVAFLGLFSSMFAVHHALRSIEP